MIATGEGTVIASGKLEQVETYTVRKRDGRLVSFDTARIFRAIEHAFRAELGLAPSLSLDRQTVWDIGGVTERVVEDLLRRAREGEQLEIELIQDAVEQQLMADGHVAVACRYIVYREQRRKARLQGLQKDPDSRLQDALYCKDARGRREPIEEATLRRACVEACRGLEPVCDRQELTEAVLSNVRSGMTGAQMARLMTRLARDRASVHPAYEHVAARLLLREVDLKVWGENPIGPDRDFRCREQFVVYIRRGVSLGLLDRRLAGFDLDRLANGLAPDRDGEWTYAGLRRLVKRCCLKHEGRLLESPQYLWMRVAMGLALCEPEGDRTDRALDFYRCLADRAFLPSETILRQAGTPHAQLGSVYAGSLPPDMADMFRAFGDAVALCGRDAAVTHDWTSIRAAGSALADGSGGSRGLLPLPGLAGNAAAAAGGRSGLAASLDAWHADVADLLASLIDRGNTPPPLQLVINVPDLFVRRVREDAQWTLFCPSEAADLRDLAGEDFDERYTRLEAAAVAGGIRRVSAMRARTLWDLLVRAVHSGRAALVFRDAVRLRAMQDHTGPACVLDSRGALTGTRSHDEMAGAVSGALNLPAHRGERGLDGSEFARTARTSVRMLDNALTNSLHPLAETRQGLLRQRPMAVGLCGLAETLEALGVDPESSEADDLADSAAEMVSYHVIRSSAELAAERGPYPGYPGSAWGRGRMPVDTRTDLAEYRGRRAADRTCAMDWDSVRALVAEQGMRHSRCLAFGMEGETAVLAGVSGSDAGVSPFGAARQQAWVDQGVVLRLPPADDLEALYERIMEAWQLGLKSVVGIPGREGG